MAIMPPALTKEMENLDKARRVKLEPNLKDSLELASLGIERDIVAKKRDAGQMDSKTAEERISDLNKRYLSAGDDLWRHQKKKMQLETDTGKIQLWRPGDCGVSECLLALHAKCDGLSKKKRPPAWRKGALDYYEGRSESHGSGQDAVWCHVSSQWWGQPFVKAAHIVPFFADNESRVDEAGNALLLNNIIEGWFDKYHVVIVPVNATETPITRWQTDILNPHIRKPVVSTGLTGQNLEGKELDFKRPEWQDVWARYYTQHPFATPGPYLRKNMLLGLATHFETTDMKVVESWVADNGFDSPLKLSGNETIEVARRVHKATEPAVEKDSSDEEEGSSEEDDHHSF
ncbi:hypothetical protein F4809DRAFT_654620 [Biscogniauxia mediterranea]|nr:hypothetical protein F4809DRAFT_654620 [Biscogniauxia mediterranea]